MSFDIIMPQLGETVAEGKILSWFKSVGDEVKEGDRLFEVETDKVTVDVEAVSAGTLSEIRVRDGESVKIGTVVAVIGGKSAEVPKTDNVSLTAPPAISGSRSPFEEVTTPLDNFGPVKGPNGLRVTPLARRLIAQNKLDIAAICKSVTSRNGTRVEERDVIEALASRVASVPVSKATLATSTPDALPVVGKVVPLNTIRQRTAERLAENWRTIPHVFQAIDIDFTKIEVARMRHKDAFRAANGIALTYLPFVARAVCAALEEFPQINARFDGAALILNRGVNLGIAIDLSHKGLVVPVVRNAEDLTVPGLAKAIGRLIEKARHGKLTSDDLAGGTYSITNNGSFGTLFTSPIINAPQVAILSMDAIRKRPSVVETAEGEFIAPRLMGVVGQSFDHRAFDGAYSAAFLSRLKKVIEERNWLEELISGP